MRIPLLAGFSLAAYAVLNIAVIALALAAWKAGWLLRAWDGDPTGISAGIVAIAGIGVLGLAFGAERLAEWAMDTVVVLGLIGTVIGFIIAFGGIDPSAAKDVDAAAEMVSIIVHGMGVALYTTLAGAVAWVWLRANIYVHA